MNEKMYWPDNDWLPDNICMNGKICDNISMSELYTFKLVKLFKSADLELGFEFQYTMARFIGCLLDV